MRKGLLVHPGFQLKIILIIVFAIWSFAGLSIYLINEVLVFVKPNLTEQQIISLDLFISQKYYAILIIAFALVVVSIALILIYTHRMVGPIYGLRKFLVKVKNGETVQAIHFRKKDYFQEIPDLINSILKK